MTAEWTSRRGNQRRDDRSDDRTRGSRHARRQCSPHCAGENGLAVLSPGSVHGIELGRGEGVAGVLETLVEGFASGRSGVRTEMFEVPAELLHDQHGALEE